MPPKCKALEIYSMYIAFYILPRPSELVGSVKALAVRPVLNPFALNITFPTVPHVFTSPNFTR